MDYSIDYVMRKIIFGVFLMCLPLSLQAGVMYEERSEYENLSEESRFCLELVEPGVECTLKTPKYSYQGDFKNGWFHGEGTLSLETGESISGVWLDGYYFGPKVENLTLADDQTIESVEKALTPEQYVLKSELRPCDGEITTWTNCFGVFSYYNGKYFGEWKQGHKHGQGLTLTSDGMKFIEHYVHGQMRTQEKKDLVKLEFNHRNL